MACGLSPAAPLVRRSFSGLPRASARTWILVLKPPRERPSACAACPPFFGGHPPPRRFLGGTGRAGVRAHDRRVDEHRLQVGVVRRPGEQPPPDAEVVPA